MMCHPRKLTFHHRNHLFKNKILKTVLWQYTANGWIVLDLYQAFKQYVKEKTRLIEIYTKLTIAFFYHLVQQVLTRIGSIYVTENHNKTLKRDYPYKKRGIHVGPNSNIKLQVQLHDYSIYIRIRRLPPEYLWITNGQNNNKKKIQLFFSLWNS